MQIRVGTGIDFHRLEAGRAFWLGGIQIPHTKGAVGHSDADVLLHAICDALLGAACLGDIGKHFPDTDMAFKNIDSKILLAKTYELLKEKEFQIINIDCTLCLEKPKINSYVLEMRKIIAEILQIHMEDISIKATTAEKLGFIGREEGVTAYATALIQKNT